MALPAPSATEDDILASLGIGEETNFTNAKQMLESFWGEYSDCFVFTFDERKEVNISQLNLVPKHWIIKELELKRVKLRALYIFHMPDLSTR